MTTDDAADLGRPVEGDVLELILEDHRRFEALLRDLRDSSADRDAARRAVAALHVAHAEAEERFVYPTLRKERAISREEEEHSDEEHAEGHRALLAVLESERVEGEDFDDLVEELCGTIYHHLTEEELTILNPARDDVPEDERRELGAAFARERNVQLDSDCGRVQNVREIVTRSERAGALSPDDEADDEADDE